MSGSEAAAGWYEDPYLSSQLRYFDGTAWTDHTSGGSTASAPLGTTVLPTSRHSMPVSNRPSAGVSGATRFRYLAISVVLVVGIVGGVLGLMRGNSSRAGTGSNSIPTLPGPRVELSANAPATVAGRSLSASTSAADTPANAANLKYLQQMPGVANPHYASYGPGPAGAPSRGKGVVQVFWAGTPTHLGPDFIAGLIDGMAKGGFKATGPTAEPNGAQMVTMATDAGALVFWVRSGTGIVEVVEFGVPPAVVESDTREVVAQLTTP